MAGPFGTVTIFVAVSRSVVVIVVVGPAVVISASIKVQCDLKKATSAIEKSPFAVDLSPGLKSAVKTSLPTLKRAARLDFVCDMVAASLLALRKKKEHRRRPVQSAASPARPLLPRQDNSHEAAGISHPSWPSYHAAR